MGSSNPSLLMLSFSAPYSGSGLSGKILTSELTTYRILGHVIISSSFMMGLHPQWYVEEGVYLPFARLIPTLCEHQAAILSGAATGKTNTPVRPLARRRELCGLLKPCKSCKRDTQGCSGVAVGEVRGLPRATVASP